MNNEPISDVQVEDENGNWVPAEPVELTCEHGSCRNKVTINDQYERIDKNLPNGWGETSEFLCSEHSIGRIKTTN